MAVEINNESGIPADEDSLQRLAMHAFDHMNVHRDAELAIVLVDEAAIEQLHVQWMDEPGPTDVLSFPMDELRPGSDDEPTHPGCSATSCCAHRSRSRRPRLLATQPTMNFCC